MMRVTRGRPVPVLGAFWKDTAQIGRITSLRVTRHELTTHAWGLQQIVTPYASDNCGSPNLILINKQLIHEKKKHIA